ncbi:MAG: hypothetical protein LBB20_01025 [Puniceicoccales bacterium]|jgi:hypothetical protein|nr:hypothetical protein [Puniceicoccales bacterium]
MMDGCITSLGNYLQNVDYEFVVSVIKVVVFLLVLVIGGMIVVRLYRSDRGCCCGNHSDQRKDYIDVIDKKALGVKSMLAVVGYGRRKFFICIHRDNVTCIGDVSDYGHKSFVHKKLHAKTPRPIEKI